MISEQPSLRPPRKGSLLAVGPGTRGRGGIAAVLHLHARTEAWSSRAGVHLSTYDDRSAFHKLWSALRAYLLAPWLISRASIVHLHVAAETSLLRKLPLAWLTKLLHRPLIVHLHAASEESLFVRTPRARVLFLFRAATRVIVLSESWAGIIRRHVPGAPVVVLPNPVLPRPYTPRLYGAGPRILFVGKLDARKGYADVLAAAALVLKQVPDAEFWFAGHGEVAQARALSLQLGIAPSVHLPGWVEGAALEDLYCRGTILTLPSYGEGVPMSVIEAMSHGIPVVCTPVGGLPEWIEDGRNGLLIQPGDRSALAAALLRLLQDRTLAATLGHAGWQTVHERCTLEMISARLDTLYDEALTAHIP